MPLPIPILIWAGVAALFGGGATAVALNWDDILIYFKGKKVVVLGARHVGKSHLIQFLTTGSIPVGYEPTVLYEKTKASRFNIEDLELMIKAGKDVTGAVDGYREWKRLSDEADIVFYLYRADFVKIGNPDTLNRITADLKHISTWLESRSPHPLFFMVGTHCDLDPEYYQLLAEKRGDKYFDEFKKLPVIKEAIIRMGGGQKTEIVLGSMKSVEETQALVFQILKWIQK